VGKMDDKRTFMKTKMVSGDHILILGGKLEVDGPQAIVYSLQTNEVDTMAFMGLRQKLNEWSENLTPKSEVKSFMLL